MWLTVDEVVELGRARRKVLVNIASGKWESREVGVGRNGRPVRLIALASLPQDLQLKWEQQNRPSGDGPPQTESSEDSLVEALKQHPAEVRDAMLREARRLAEIVERYDAIEMKRVNGNWQTDPLVTSLCSEAICTDKVILSYYEGRRHSVRAKTKLRGSQCPSPRTLYRWSKGFKKDGLLTFLPSPSNKKTKSDRRNADIDPRASAWIDANWRTCATPRALFQRLTTLAQKHSWTIPSERWIYRRWRSLPKPVKTLALHGEKAYISKCAPYVPRDYSDLDALQVLCGDHSVRDVTVRLPNGHLTRPWLTLWQDLRTGLLWGWHLDLTPSSTTAGLAYANGVRTYGAQPLSRPEEDYWSYIYTDQGKDYKSHNIDGKVLVFKQAMAIEGGLDTLRVQRRVGLIDELGLKHLLARGYNAREKPVERVHRDISDWEQSTFESEFCGRDAKNKPDAWREAWSRHQRLLKQGGAALNDSPFMALEDYREALSGRILEYNHSEHQRSTLGGITVVPIEEYKRLYTTHFEISDESLALLLMKAESRVVGKNGIWLHRRNWFYLHPALTSYKGQRVEVRYSEDDYSSAWVIAPDGQIIEAKLVTPTSILNPNKQTMALVKEAAAHERKTLREFSFITQSRIRGESVEDQIAAKLGQEEEVEAIAAAGGSSSAAVVQNSSAPSSSARVHRLTRMDRRKLRSVTSRIVTAEEVSKAEEPTEIFSDNNGTARSKVSEFDFDE